MSYLYIVTLYYNPLLLPFIVSLYHYHLLYTLYCDPILLPSIDTLYCYPILSPNIITSIVTFYYYPLLLPSIVTLLPILPLTTYLHFLFKLLLLLVSEVGGFVDEVLVLSVLYLLQHLQLAKILLPTNKQTNIRKQTNI